MSKTSTKKRPKTQHVDPVAEAIAEDKRLALEAAEAAQAIEEGRAAQLKSLMDTGQRLYARAAVLNLEIEDIKKQIKALWPQDSTGKYKTGTYTAGEGVMVVGHTSSLDKTTAEKLYGERVMELQVTAAAVKAAGLTDEQIEALYTRSISVGWK